MASWRRLDLALRSFPVVQEPVGFKAAVMTRIDREEQFQLPASPLWQNLSSALLSAMAGSAMVLVGLVMVLMNSFGVAAMLDWLREGLLWGGLYLEVASPFLLVSGWLLTGAFAVAVLGLATAERRRLVA